jgi:hypothetical protein
LCHLQSAAYDLEVMLGSLYSALCRRRLCPGLLISPGLKSAGFGVEVAFLSLRQLLPKPVHRCLLLEATLLEALDLLA